MSEAELVRNVAASESGFSTLDAGSVLLMRVDRAGCARPVGTVSPRSAPLSLVSEESSSD